MAKPKRIRLSKSEPTVSGAVHLDGSKSISNRVLIIRALSRQSFAIRHLSTSDDTRVLDTLLRARAATYDVGHAGTSFRFLTALMAIREGRQVITGSARMKKRPIAPLVDALNQIGAQVRYLGETGYPPLEAGAFREEQYQPNVVLEAGISSQYVTALALIAPTLPKGLTIELKGTLVSQPYVRMTLRILEYFGIRSTWDGQRISIEPQSFVARAFDVEADWSAASYYYAIAALSQQARVVLHGLHENSLQGDASIVQIARTFGVESRFQDGHVIIEKTNAATPSLIEQNFLKQPDLAQTVSVMSAGLGIESFFSGLQTLAHKETDRVAALQHELAKCSVFLTKLPPRLSKKTGEIYYHQAGRATHAEGLRFETYDDHRMAMAFAPLSVLFPIEIEHPAVVSKSYPDFWQHLQQLGFHIEE